MIKYLSFWLLILLILCCNKDKSGKKIASIISPDSAQKTVDNSYNDSIKRMSRPIDRPDSDNQLELHFIENGLVDIQILEPSILVDLKYGTINNFVHIDLYHGLHKCYLQNEAAQKLSHAQQLLKERYPQLTLLVYDGARPYSVQRLLWDTLQVPEKMKHLYVADPEKGSIHNYGAAVDLTLADSLGKTLDMGTDFDYFGTIAYPVKEAQLLKEGKLSPDQLNNRLILRNVMLDAGFTPITTEWWHFNSCTRIRANKMYKRIE